MTFAGWIFVLLSALFVVAANLMLRAGVDQAGGFAGNLSSVHLELIKLVKQPVFDVGVIFYALASIVWFRVLSSEPLSIAYPILVSTTFIMVTMGAILFYKESINILKIFGIFVIIIGIMIVSRS